MPRKAKSRSRKLTRVKRLSRRVKRYSRRHRRGGMDPNDAAKIAANNAKQNAENVIAGFDDLSKDPKLSKKYEENADKDFKEKWERNKKVDDKTK